MTITNYKPMTREEMIEWYMTHNRKMGRSYPKPCHVDLGNAIRKGGKVRKQYRNIEITFKPNGTWGYINNPGCDDENRVAYGYTKRINATAKYRYDKPVRTL